MVVEVLLLVPLLVMCYFGVVSLKTVIAMALFIYWIPKWFFISLLEKGYPEIVTRNNTLAKTVALTFDDLPYGSHEEIIQRLDNYNTKATLFIISGQITPKNEEVFVKAVKNGHQLGNHGKTNSMHALKSNDALQEEIDDCDKTIRRIYTKAGVTLPEMYYRPGCGVFTDSMLQVVKDSGYKLALGSVYPNDPMIPSGVLNYYYLISHLEHGDVVILHDRSWTVTLLDHLLVWMKDNNYKSVTLNTLHGM